MRKLAGVIATLATVENGAQVYDLSNASWLRKFKDLHPTYIALTFNEDPDPRSPIFRAELTSHGKQYLNELRSYNEVPRLREAVS